MTITWPISWLFLFSFFFSQNLTNAYFDTLTKHSLHHSISIASLPTTVFHLENFIYYLILNTFHLVTTYKLMNYRCTPSSIRVQWIIFLLGVGWVGRRKRTMEVISQVKGEGKKKEGKMIFSSSRTVETNKEKKRIMCEKRRRKRRKKERRIQWINYGSNKGKKMTSSAR